jgi:hypothetical protein
LGVKLEQSYCGVRGSCNIVLPGDSNSSTSQCMSQSIPASLAASKAQPVPNAEQEHTHTRIHTRMHTHTHTHTQAHAHARTRMHARTHAMTPIKRLLLITKATLAHTMCNHARIMKIQITQQACLTMACSNIPMQHYWPYEPHLVKHEEPCSLFCLIMSRQHFHAKELSLSTDHDVPCSLLCLIMSRGLLTRGVAKISMQKYCP